MGARYNLLKVSFEGPDIDRTKNDADGPKWTDDESLDSRGNSERKPEPAPMSSKHRRNGNIRVYPVRYLPGRRR